MDEYPIENENPQKHKYKGDSYKYNYNNKTNSFFKYNNHYKYKNNNNYSKYNKNSYSKHKDINYYINRLDPSKISVPELTLTLIKDLTSKKLTCLICEVRIKEEEEIWSCFTCHSILHLKCIEEWIRKKNPDYDFGKAQGVIKGNIKNILKWKCPHCNFLYEDYELPQYNCFCGKYYEAVNSKNEHLDTELIPHGCGLYCGAPICKHISKCPIPCHPGPHVVCKEKLNIYCFCGKVQKEVPCSFESETEFTCGGECGKQLKCGKKNHICRSLCHAGKCEQFFKEGKCPDCLSDTRRKFFDFLKNTLEKKLNDEVEEAEKMTHFASCLTAYVFDGELPCKVHRMKVNTMSCLKLLLKIFEIKGDKILTNIKNFIPICNKTAEICCRCRNKKVTTKCFKLNYPPDILQFLQIQPPPQPGPCSKPCRTKKSCGIHICERICCELRDVQIINFSIQDPKGLHLCMRICGKTLNCGKHNCESFCHKGNCKECAFIEKSGKLTCECGKTVKEAPYICGTVLFCPFPCSRKRESCSHPCPLLCHKDPCPPCKYQVSKTCRCGRHTFPDKICSDKTQILCFDVCGAMLPCGVHFCQLKCHKHTKEYDDAYICNMNCGRMYTMCEHLCMEKCHGEGDCDEYKCKAKSYLICKCGTRKEPGICGEIKKKKDEFKKNNEGQELFIECDEECQRQERLRNINSAFQGLKNLSDSKMKLLYPNCACDGSEEVKRENAGKYLDETIYTFIDNFDEYFRVENELYAILKKNRKLKEEETGGKKKNENEDNKENNKDINDKENNNSIKNEKEDKNSIKNEDDIKDNKDNSKINEKNKEIEEKDKDENKEKDNKKIDVTSKIEEKTDKIIKEEQPKKNYLIKILEKDFNYYNEWLILYHGIKPKLVFKQFKKETNKEDNHEEDTNNIKDKSNQKNSEKETDNNSNNKELNKGMVDLNKNIVEDMNDEKDNEKIKDTYLEKIIEYNKNIKDTYKIYYLQLNDVQLNKFYYQKYRLSLIALLFMNNLFITKPKYRVYHPFKYSIEIRYIKGNSSYENVDEALMSTGFLPMAAYYLYKYDEHSFYVHFFDENLGKKVYDTIKTRHIQFEEVYEITYEKENFNESYLYKYLRNQDYLNYLRNGYEKNYVSDPKNWTKKAKEKIAVDEDGFTVVKKSKKKWKQH